MENRNRGEGAVRRIIFRTSVGVPVSCEIYVERNLFGDVEVLRSVEIERSTGIRILSQSQVEEDDVLLIYRQWRRRPENQNRIQRINIDPIFRDYVKSRKNKR